MTERTMTRTGNATAGRCASGAAVMLTVMALLAGCSTSKTPAPETTAVLSNARIAEIVASPGRSAADLKNDERRKPAQVLAFIGVRPGWVVLDLSAGGGYTSELMARAVGPTGRVYAQGRGPALSKTLAARVANPETPNIVVVTQPFEAPVPAEVASGGLDLVTLMFDYHDFGHMGVDRDRVNRAVFAALKPGGHYVLADHSGRPGTGISESGTLHRIEESFMQSEIEAIGFRLVASGNFLRNPADPRDKEEPDPPMPKDEFFLKFVKP